MQFSKYFNSEIDRKILNGNQPTPEQIENLKRLCKELDKVREATGAIVVTSGLRSVQKQIELVKCNIGSNTSQHLTGEALDIVSLKINTQTLFDYIRKHCNFDQLIFETNKDLVSWVHISLKKEYNRKQVLYGRWNSKANRMEYYK